MDRTPTPRPTLAERHYFTCDGEMLAWAQTWYTEAFYITAEASYDAAASTGPVQPPSSVWDTVAVCARSISAAEASAGASASAAGSSGSGSTKAAAAAQTASSSSTISASASTVSSLIPASTLGPLSPSTSAGSNIAAVGLASTDRCAGNWDYQAWAAVSSIVLTCVLGAAVWALWAGLRARLPLYAPRAYLLRPDLAAFFLPFLDLPELAPPLSSAHLVLRVHWAALRLASLAALVALATVLPLTVAGVPCLSLTAPANSLGGRLGTLNDLSLLRLLDAQNPADSSTGRIATRALVEALHSARARLIAIVALTALTAGSSIFLLARLQFRLFRYGRRHAELRGGQEMVVLRNEWEVVNQATMGSRLGAAKEHGVDIAGVFAVPRMTRLVMLDAERERVLEELEVAEAQLVRGRPDATMRAEPAPSHARPTHPSRPARLSDQNPIRTRLASLARSATLVSLHPGQHGVAGSAFVELPGEGYAIGQPVNRDPTAGGNSEGQSPDPDSPGMPGPSGGAHAMQPETNATETPPLGSTSTAARQMATPGPPDAQSCLLCARLRELNTSIKEEQARVFAAIAHGQDIVGWVVIGKGVELIPGAQVVEGYTKEDIVWADVGRRGREVWFWISTGLSTLAISLLSIPFLGLAVGAAPGFAHYLPFLKPLVDRDGLPEALAEGIVPALGMVLLVFAGMAVCERLATRGASVSRAHQRALGVKGSTYLLLAVAIIWTVCGALEFAVQGFAQGDQQARQVGDGATYITWIVFIVLINAAVVIPGLQLLRPFSLWQWWRANRRATTPRQRFRTNRTMSFSLTLPLALPLLCTFCAPLVVLFPLLSIPVLVGLYLSFVASHHGADYVSSSAGDDGRLALWLTRRVAWSLALQPAALGLVLVTRGEWTLGATSLAVAATALAAAECALAGLGPPRPSRARRRAIREAFKRALSHDDRADDRRPGLESPTSILALVHALLPSVARLDAASPVPLRADDIDDLIAPLAAAYATPRGLGAYPHGPPAHSDAADQGEGRGLLYPPQLLRHEPDVWIPAGQGAIARAERLARKGLVALVDPVDIALEQASVVRGMGVRVDTV